MNEKHLYTSEDKLAWWDYGEWIEEPDIVTWTYKDYNCKIIRIAMQEPYTEEFEIFGGHLSGYVTIPFKHPYHHKIYEDMDIEIHGGLTFGKVLNRHWIGFDCRHTGDYVPSIEKFRRENEHLKRFKETFMLFEGFEKHAIFNPIYRNIAFCIEECQSIVDQLVQIYELTEDRQRSKCEHTVSLSIHKKVKMRNLSIRE